MTSHEARVISLGSAQSERLADALLPGHFDVDEMSFETLLVFVKEIAGQLHFYNLDNNREGNWQPMFLGSDLVIIAMLQTINSRRISMEFEERLKGNIEQTIPIIIQLFSDINLAYSKLKVSESKTAFELCLKISSAVDKKLLSQLQAFKSLSDGGTPQIKQQMQHFLMSLDKLWAIDPMPELEDELSPEMRGAQHSEQAPDLNHHQRFSILQQCFTTLMNTVRFLQTDLHLYLKELKSQANHDPAMGLLMAFLKIYRLSQSQLNGFTMKHLDFYYRKLLKFSPQAPVAESSYLVFTPVKGLSNPSILTKGCEFSCGKNEQLQDIIFTLDDDLLLSNARVCSVVSLFLHRDPLISPESELHYVTQVVKNKLDSEPKGSNDNVFPTFGANSLLGGENQTQAQLGFGISAPILNLKEGHRSLSLAIALTEYQQINSHLLYLLISSVEVLTKHQHLAAIVSELLSSESEPRFSQARPATDPKDSQKVGAFHPLTQEVLSQLLPWQVEEIFASPGTKTSQFIYKHYLLALLVLATHEAHFYRTFGRIFSRHTLSFLGDNETGAAEKECCAWLSLNDIELIDKKSQQFSTSSGVTRLLRLLRQDQLRSFYELYETMFDIHISTADGWLEIDNYRINPLRGKVKGDDLGLYGFQFDIPLTADIPPIVPCDPKIHGDMWVSGEPCIQFAIKPLATFFPYSIFRSLILSSVDIDVTVKGLTELVAYNSHGRLDPSKSFVPFGALPSLHSDFILGSEEMAKKHIQSVDINIDWALLPMGFDGFKEHYAGYPYDYDNQSFKVNIQVLRDGNWLNASHGALFSLFDNQSGNRKLSGNKCLSSIIANEFKPVARGRSELEFDYNLKSRNGFIKLVLAAPNKAFGHQDHSGLLTQTLMENAKLKLPKPLPNAPYTPTVSKLSLNYHAQSVIYLHPQNQKKMLPHHSVTHIHPFGFQQIYPVNSSRLQPELQSLFPRYAFDGNLFIGLEAHGLADEISLFFELDEKANLNRGDGASDIHWFYLLDNHWQAFDERQILADSTSGFITSGIVTFRVPANMTANNSVMPAGQFWIRASANRDLNCYGRCLSISAHGAKVTRRLKADETGTRLTGIAQWKAIQAQVGLAKISQLTPSFAGKSAEQSPEFKQRVSERLRHKGRAVTPWDYERLILEAFPEVERVKCFPNLIYQTQGTFPGHILIMVRLRVSMCAHTPCDNFHASSKILNNIQCYISRLCAEFISVDVRNPIYESLQVRCAVKFNAGVHPGSAIRQLNQDICDFLCPWSERGNVGFGWTLKVKDIESFIRHQPYIKFVTQVSALHIVAGNQGELANYQLLDSVNVKAVPSELNPDPEAVIQASSPWCLLMPFSHHVIALVEDEYDLRARATGVDELEVGGNFIVCESEPETDDQIERKGSQHNG
ncbi:baseplate J/gp47 family protein [Shewanella frigidimarina]|uniref:Uncharacterized protein n=1 Tax=Shewanella frigidimarina TaxID=56812 RepID=A0A125BET0_SHEFR|nr:baseplate J/gp47 family protein [Shewanella frigidimarina]KVX02770.1 hypothetical protein AWJ07_12845 [Shewanella frigidimarina]